MNIWKRIPKPIIAMAPMANVTDNAFRSLFAECGPPDIFWTEFVSADGLVSSGREMLLRDLEFTKNQHPIVAQFFTSKPENIATAVDIARSLDFDGVDINMGCPDTTIEKQGSGAALIRTPDRAIEIIKAAKKAGEQTQKGEKYMPISVKTRIGYAIEEIDRWIPTILKTGIEALSVHLRTRKDMSNTKARWDAMNRIVTLRDAYAPETCILGNGDITSRSEAEQKIVETGCDGILVGRGMFGNPWFFNKKISRDMISITDRLQVLIKHIELFETMFDTVKPFHIMKKHFKAYVSDFEGAKELRIVLMETTKAKDAKKVIQRFLNISA